MLVRHSVEEPFDVLFCTHDAWKTEHFDRWVIGVNAHVHAVFLTGRHDGFEEVLHVGTELRLVDTFVEVKEVAELLNRSSVVLAEVTRHKALGLDDDVLHQFVVFLRSHRLGEFVALGEDVATCTHTSRKLELGPLLTSTLAFQDVDVEVGELGIVEVEVRGAVGVLVQQVCTCPVEHRHEVVTDAVDALGREITERFLIHFNLLITVGTAIFDGLHHGQTLHYAPAHSITLDVCLQVVNLLACPYLTKRHVVQGGDDALHTNLFELGKGDFVFLAKPTPCSFHID